MNNIKKYIKKYINKNNIKIILLFISVLFTFIFLYLGIKEYQKINNDVTPYDYVLLRNRDTDSQNRYVTLTFNNYEIINKEDDYNYLLVNDNDKNYFVIRVTNNELNKIISNKKVKVTKFSYTVKGYLKNINKDLKNKIIVKYQNIDKDINQNNFSTYLSTTYLDVDGIPTSNYYFYIALLFVIIILIILYLYKGKRYKKR